MARATPPRILIVDDEPAQRQILSRLLAARGFQPVAAASAAEALEKLSSAGAPRLMLIDVSMPGVDGITLLKALRASPATALVPMILMSGLAVPSSLMEAAAAALGAGPIFFKGDDPETLLARVGAALESLPPARAGAQAAVVIDPVKRTMRIGERLIPPLPPHRFQVLCALARAPRALGREELLALVWNGSDNLNLVDVTIARLRRDLSPFRELAIETTPGGYRLAVGSRRRPRSPGRAPDKV
jgi:DNA-binding response OmpR family regulator